MKIVFSIFILTLTLASHAKNIAKVKILRGDVVAIEDKLEKRVLRKGDWVKEGETIVTAKKSFVRLSFIDDSKVNLGPNSRVKIEQFKDDAPGVLNVVTGKIRAEVSKDYLKMQKNKSKLFVRSSNAVMGIRGTDFLFSSNLKTKNTIAVLFEGSVVFNKLEVKDIGNISKYEAIVSNGQSIKPGEFSSVSSFGKLLKSQRLNRLQLLNLKNNKEISSNKKTFVPRGLTKELVSINKDSKPTKIDDKGPVIHFNSGTVILDSKIQNKGVIDGNGEFSIPENTTLSKDGNTLKRKSIKKKIISIPQPEGENFKPASFLHGVPTVKRPEIKKRSKVNINIKNPSLP